MSEQSVTDRMDDNRDAEAGLRLIQWALLFIIGVSLAWAGIRLDKPERFGDGLWQHALSLLTWVSHGAMVAIALGLDRLRRGMPRPARQVVTLAFALQIAACALSGLGLLQPLLPHGWHLFWKISFTANFAFGQGALMVLAFALVGGQHNRRLAWAAVAMLSAHAILFVFVPEGWDPQASVLGIVLRRAIDVAGVGLLAAVVIAEVRRRYARVTARDRATPDEGPYRTLIPVPVGWHDLPGIATVVTGFSRMRLAFLATFVIGLGSGLLVFLWRSLADAGAASFIVAASCLASVAVAIAIASGLHLVGRLPAELPGRGAAMAALVLVLAATAATLDLALKSVAFGIGTDRPDLGGVFAGFPLSAAGTLLLIVAAWRLGIGIRRRSLANAARATLILYLSSFLTAAAIALVALGLWGGEGRDGALVPLLAVFVLVLFVVGLIAYVRLIGLMSAAAEALRDGDTDRDRSASTQGGPPFAP